MRPILLPRLPVDITETLADWILDNMPPYAKGAVLGMSGGIDSSTVAALTQHAFSRSYPPVNIEKDPDNPQCFLPDLVLLGYSLPTDLNAEADHSDAKRVAKMFDITFSSIDIRAMMDHFLVDEPLSAYDKGNAISRMRANVLWTLAAHHKSIVMGTGNKDEDYGIGYYTLLGDGAVYMNPIGCLSKRLVRQLGKQLGLPDDLVNRTPTAGLEPDQTDEKDLGYTYEFVELVMEGIAQGFSLNDLGSHPQLRNELWRPGGRGGRWDAHGGAAPAIFDVLHRHDLALRKAEYIRPKVPRIELPLGLPG